jgi:K+-transporting ATPase KdpF subunit
MVEPRMNPADLIELALSVAMLVYLFYALIRPERF